jgi:hypothetical protein
VLRLDFHCFAARHLKYFLLLFCVALQHFKVRPAMHFSTTILALLLSASSALAAPLDRRIEDIQCRCLSFAIDAKPTVCTYMGAHRLDWDTASSLASDYDLKINFASQSTIARVLAIRKPLPISVLQSISEGEAMLIEDEDLMQRENKIVCGFRDEVEQLGGRDVGLEEPECHYVGYVVAAFMLLVACYVLAEYVWSRYVFTAPKVAHAINLHCSFFSQGSIKLDGDEKALMAEYKASREAQEQHVEVAAPVDLS